MRGWLLGVSFAIAFWVLASLFCHWAGAGEIPNPSLTPGALCTALDPDFNGPRYKEKIPHCVRHLTVQLKTIVAKAYGIPRSQWHLYEFDHFFPLALGGSNSVFNIWPEPLGQAAEKDRLEDRLYHALLKGTMTQQQAIRAIKAWRPKQSTNGARKP